MSYDDEQEACLQEIFCRRPVRGSFDRWLFVGWAPGSWYKLFIVPFVFHLGRNLKLYWQYSLCWEQSSVTFTKRTFCTVLQLRKMEVGKSVKNSYKASKSRKPANGDGDVNAATPRLLRYWLSQGAIHPLKRYKCFLIHVLSWWLSDI